MFSISKQIYPWKRFWCQRSDTMNLTPEGYLCDPDSQWGNVHNPDLVTLDKIADIPCLILLGEPGVGKSQEMQNLVEYTKENLKPSYLPLEFNLRSCSNLTTDLIQGQDFTDWVNGNHRLYLFLDSLDEGLLEIRNLATQLVDEFKKKKYSDKLDRLYLRIACRTFVFPEILETELKKLWEKEDLGIYELAPLRQTDIIEAAKIEGVSSGDFIAEIESKNIVSLAIKPVTLGFLLNIYQRNNGQFPPNQRLHELYLDGCKLLCDEVSSSRRASAQTGDLDSDQRLVIVARIASVTIFANRFAVWKGIDFGNVPEEDVVLKKISQGYENANGKSFEITREFVEETLDTGLFSSRGSHRIGWAHQTYSEYLAAWYLVKREISLPLISKLFFSSEDSGHKLIPQLHETAAWLATMKEDFLQEVIKTDPDVLLRSDIPTDAKLRASIVDNLLKLYEQEKLFDRYNENYYRYKKLKHPELASQLHPYISDSNKQFDARELAIHIADVCEVSELQEELVNLALDSSQIIHLRVSAAKAIFSIGDSTTKLKLKRLAVSNILEDEDDRLKGYVLRALWSENISSEDLFNLLTTPKKRNFLGSYQIFIDHDLVQKIQPEHLVTALKWLEKQGVRCFGHPFEKLGNSIILKAWENFDLPEIVESFTKAILVQLKDYQPIITDDNLQIQFRSSLIEDITKRHKLIEHIVLVGLESKADPDNLIYYLTKSILVSDDFLWIIEKFKDAKSQDDQLIWIRLIQNHFNRQDAKHIDAIITAIHNNDVLLLQAFIFEFEAVELNSDTAKTMRTYYLERQAPQHNNHNSSILNPSPKQRVLELLDKLESGDLDAWWRLNMEMTLQPDSQYYDNEFELDLTKLSGWQEAEKVTRRRIIEGAKQYIQQKSNINYDWIGTNNFDRPALAGFRALQLLIKERLDFLDTVSSSIWKKWASVIVASPSDNQYEDNYLEVIRLAYRNAPQESIDTLLRLIDEENKQYDYISVINRFEKCWDQRLKDALLKKVKISSLKPKCIGQLLEELLKHGSLEAKDFTISLISSPLSSIEEENEKTLIASRVLVENSDSSSWASIWMLIQQDVSFGRKIFEAVSYRYSHGVDLNLTETQQADLYLWLVQQYPYGEDPDYSNEVLAHNVTTRETIGNFRDSVLAQLKERGTSEACTEIERLIQELPNLEWLKKTLLYAQKNMRFKSWQPMKPDEVLQLLAPKTVSNPEISDKINEYHEDVKRMSDEPKVKVVNSQGVNIACSNSGNAEQKINAPEPKKKFDWTVILAVLGIVASITVSGLFNEEVRQFLFKKNPSPPIQEKSSPNNSQPR